jgi:signal transduction histidine kinase
MGIACECFEVNFRSSEMEMGIMSGGLHKGSGIEEEIYQSMFQPHRTTKSEGTGLGLWLSRNIVINHRGTIFCRSSRRPGRNGTTFRLSLPVSDMLPALA